MGRREKKKSPNFYASPQNILSGLQRYFSLKRVPFPTSLNQGSCASWKERAWKIFQPTLVLCQTKCSDYRSHEMAHGLCPDSHSINKRLWLGIRRMSYYSLISFIVFLTANIFHFLSAKSKTSIVATVEVSGKKYNSRALIPPSESIHISWQWNILLLPKNPLQCVHRAILVNINLTTANKTDL